MGAEIGPAILLCPEGTMDSQEASRLSVPRLECEGHHSN